MKYILSPEFHRQLWLRFTPLRLLAAPVVLGLLTYLQTEFEALALTMLFVYFFVVIVWGTLEAGTSVSTEMRTNTWDFQCMSSISPARLCFGKLFGATSYTWYVGLQALAIFGYAYAHDRVNPGPHTPIADDTLDTVLGLFLAGLLGQAAAYLNYLVDLSSLQGRTTRALLPGGIGAFLMGVFIAGIALGFVSGNANHFQNLPPPEGYHVGWYGAAYNAQAFLLASLLFFVGWFLIGGWRLIRVELMYRNWPLVWVLFVVSLIAWDSGFLFSAQPVSDAVGHHARLAMPARSDPVSLTKAAFYAFLQVAVITYAAMLSEAADLRKYARLAFFAKAGDLRRALENTPKWCATLPVAVVLYAWLLGASPDGGDAQEILRLTTILSALSLFMLRDGIVIHGVHNLNKGRGGRFTILLYFVMAYVLLPLVVLTAGGPSGIGPSLDQVFGDSGGLGGLRQAVAFFYPLVLAKPAFSILPPFAEALVAAVGLHFILQRRAAADIIANTKA